MQNWNVILKTVNPQSILFTMAQKIAILHIYFILILMVLDITNAEHETCVKPDPSWYDLRGSTTDYDSVRGHGNLSVESCTPHKIWGYFRHGIKRHNKKAIHRTRQNLIGLKDKILESHKNGKGTLCDVTVKELAKWRMDNLTEFEPSFLTSRGLKQAYDLGQRMKINFPILNRDYDGSVFYFSNSNRQRSFATMRGFVDGLFSQDINFESAYIGKYDPVTDYSCQSYILAPFENNYEGRPFAHDYAKKTSLFETIAEKLSHITGLQRRHFTRSIIVLIFNTCTYETAANVRLSPWCSMFDQQDMRRMLLREEIVAYTGYSYGSENGNKVGCIQTKSLVSFFNETVERGTSGYLMKSYFGHDYGIHEMLTGLGCFKTELTGDYLSSDFTWNVTNITPFGANLAAVLYKCEGADDVHKLQFFLNEKPIGCCLTEDTEACSWTDFKNKMSNFVLNCKEDFCDDSVST